MKKLLLGLIPAAMFMSACSTTLPDGTVDRNNKVIGAVIGGVAGAVLGGQLDDDGNRDKGTIIGAVTGAAAGAGVGHIMDKQEEQFRTTLRQEREQHAIEIQRLKEDTLKLTLNDNVSFDFNSAQVKPSFYVSLDKLAGVLAQHNQSRVTVVGHTDSVGSDSYNKALSERRASAVSSYLKSKGVSASRLGIQGMGESQPRATNATDAGRSQNRRVEIIVQQPPAA